MKRRTALEILGLSAGIATIFGLDAFGISSKAIPNKPAIIAQQRNLEEIAEAEVHKSTWETYGTNIIYQNFSDIGFSALPQKRIEIPEDLGIVLARPMTKNETIMQNLIAEELLKKGYTSDTVVKLPAREAINLAVKIVGDKFTYYDVDKDEDFIKKHGAHLPIEKYFELGLGDCDKYTYSFIEVFNFIKNINPNLTNIYVSDSGLGGNIQPHQWNSIVSLREDKIILTHLDVTAYDNGRPLEGQRGFHVPYDNDLLLAQFYNGLNDFNHAYKFYEKVLPKCQDIDCRAEILDNMIFAAYMNDDKASVNLIRKEFSKLSSKKNLTTGILGGHYENILYYSYETEKKAGNINAAKKFKKQLLKKFPKSYWIKNLD